MWGSLREAGRVLGWVALGGAAAGAAGLGWFAWKGVLGAMWECAVEYTGAYAALTGNPLQSGWLWLSSGKWWWWIVPAGLVVWQTATGRGAWRMWGVVVAVAFATALTDVNGHYHVMVLPLAAVSGGALLGRLAKQGRRGGAAAVGLVALMAAGGAGYWGLTPEKLSRKAYGGNPFAEAEECGQLVAAMSRAGERVHVAGSEPEILWYARRRGATRFDIAYPCCLPTVHAEGYRRDMMLQLAEAEPRVVVLSTVRTGYLGPDELVGAYARGTMGWMNERGYRAVVGHAGKERGWVDLGTGERWDGVMSLVVFLRE